MIVFAAATGARGRGQAATSSAQAPKPATHRIIALAEPGNTIHQPFADAATAWLQDTSAREGFLVDYIRAYLAAHDLFIQVNHPPYRWTPGAEAAFKKAMEQGTIEWVGFHHASLLGKFDGFEMSPFFHQFMGNIVFKSYIPDFATGRSSRRGLGASRFQGPAGAIHDRERRVVHLRPVSSSGCARAGHCG